MHFIITLLLSFFTFTQAKTWYLDDLLPKPPQDATIVFNSLLTTLKSENDSIVTFRQSGMTYFMSSPDGRAVYFFNLSNFQFDANGNKFIFDREMKYPPGYENICIPNSKYSPTIPENYYGTFFGIDSCYNCTFKNIVVDWNWDRWRLANEVTVLPGSNNFTWNLQFIDKNIHRLPNGTIDYDRIYAWKSLHTLDETMGSMGTHSGQEIWAKSWPKFTPGQNDTVKVEFFKPNNLIPDVGKKYLLRHFSYEQHAFFLRRCNGCTFSHITTYSCGGKLFVVEEDSRNLIFDNVNMIKPDEDRPITCVADGIFMSGTKGNISILNSELGWHGDDCINFHDPISSSPNGIKITSPTEIFIQGNRFLNYYPGDEIQVVSWQFNPLWNGKVLQSRGDGCGNWSLQISPSINLSNPEKFILLNKRFDATNLKIDGLYCHHNRARGVLIMGNNVTLTNSKFEEIQMSAILIRANSKEAEGSGVSNVLISGNSFKNVDKNSVNNGSFVDLHVKFPTTWDNDSPGLQLMELSPDSAPLKNITIVGNKISGTSLSGIHVSAADDVIIKNNVIENPQPYSHPHFPYIGTNKDFRLRGDIAVRASRNVIIDGNQWMNTVIPGGTWIESSTTSNISTFKTNVQDGKEAFVEKSNDKWEDYVQNVGGVVVPSPSPSGGLSIGTIVGIVIGCLALAGIVVGGAYLVSKKRKQAIQAATIPELQKVENKNEIKVENVNVPPRIKYETMISGVESDVEYVATDLSPSTSTDALLVPPRVKAL